MLYVFYITTTPYLPCNITRKGLTVWHACNIDNVCIYRYYAGDQQSLFREAHLVYPPNRSKQLKPVNPKVPY